MSKVQQQSVTYDDKVVLSMPSEEWYEDDYLTDADAWFVQTDAPNGLLTFWSRNKEFGKDNDFDSDNAKFKSTMALAVGWTDPRCIYGSAGA